MFVRIRTYYNKQESGQVLIQLAVMMVVLLGFVSLAIDVGNVYSERRRMQNAADAGALAGARELCLVEDADLAIAKAKEYMISNGVAAGDIGAGDVTVTGNVVDTTARKTANTFIAGVIGFDSLDVNAEAAAACGAANTGCGLWPIAFDQSLWEELYDDGAGCGKEFVVWNDESNPLTCTVAGILTNNLCGCYQCDLNADGEDDFAVLNGPGRAWLDYPAPTGGPFTDACSANGCGASELACHISNDSGAQVSLNQCIAGDNGVKAGVKNAIDSRIGDHVNISLYSGTCTSTENCNGQAYHITSFGCVDVVGWVQNFQLNPKLVGYKKEKGKAIRVRMNCNGDCVTACGGTDGTPAEPWQLKAVSLTK